MPTVFVEGLVTTKTATIKQIAEVSTDFSGNLHWEELDADIELESLENPEDYPLIYRKNELQILFLQ